MCRFIESIRVEDGHPCLLPFHEERMNRTRAAFFPAATSFSLAGCLPEGAAGPGVWKWRLVYDREGIREWTCVPYVMRPVKSLRLVTDDTVEYAYKRVDRSVLEACFARRGQADDVLIVRRGLLTDTSIANIALWNGQRWYTPASPLLRGVRRRALLEAGVLEERDISAGDLGRYTRIRLFNALIGWGELELPVCCVSACE